MDPWVRFVFSVRVSPMAALPTFLPLSEAARKYGLDEARLRAMIEKGKIRAGVIAGRGR